MSQVNGFKIEDDIPPPDKSAGRNSPAGDAVRSLQPGQSVVLPIGCVKDISAMVAQIKKTTGRKFASRAVEGGRRIWRLA